MVLLDQGTVPTANRNLRVLFRIGRAHMRYVLRILGRMLEKGGYWLFLNQNPNPKLVLT